ncbi:MAG TPA: membrane protein insertion efficiency factor YidD [Ilumatobacter sp.]
MNTAAAPTERSDFHLADVERAPGRVERALLRSIDWYQRGAEGRPSPCRFFPGCSEYGHEAIAVHGPVRGVLLTLRRLLRCRPFGPSGFDPVPPGRGDVRRDPLAVSLPEENRS